MSEEGLPEGWADATLEQVAAWGSGGTPSRRNTEYYKGDIPWFKTGELGPKTVSSAEEHISQSAIASSSAKIFPKGAVGIAMYGATIGKTSIWGIEASTNQACAVAIADENALHNVFLYYFLFSQKYRFTEAGKGGAQPNISQGLLKSHPIALPPLAEQKRIVAKIEELFAKLDKGIESIRDAQARLKLYRHSLLKHAFEGKLTSDWRASNADKLETPDQILARIECERAARHAEQMAEWKQAVAAWEKGGEEGKKPTKPRVETKFDKPTSEQKALMSDVPVSWQWLQIADFAFVTKLAGFEYTKFVNYDESGDLPVIKAENAGPLGFRETDFSKVQSAAVSMLTRSHLKGGELLMVFVGAGTGNVAMVPEDRRFFLGPNIGMMRVESDCVLPRYVEVFLRSPIGRELTLATVKAVAQPSLSMGTIRQIPIALPSPEEQVELLRILEAKISGVEAIEAEVETQLAKSEALRQSILKQAFSGKLVPQDPNDEPASELLERIRAERAAAKPPKRQPRKRKAKAKA